MKIMSAPALNTSSTSPVCTSFCEKLSDVLVSPGEVFDEVVAAPNATVNWRLPTLLLCLVNIVSLQISGAQHTASVVEKLAGAGAVSRTQIEILGGSWVLVSSLTVCLAVVAGTFWSSFVLWFVGRAFLKVRFSFLKALEVVGLTSIILALGTVITALLVLATGNIEARPSLSLFVGGLDPAHPVRRFLDTFNVFNLWTTTALAIGLSKLSGVSFKEAAFWVFGYWLFARIALILLA